MILFVLLLLIFLACLASLYREGMWGNALRLINVVTAALLAVNFFEPAARALEGMGDFFGSFTYFLDFLCLWGLFVIFMLILRGLTDTLSRVKVRFLKIADQIGSVFFAAWTGWVLICFTMMSLHTAPLPRNFMMGQFDPENAYMFMGLGPDRQWLGFVQGESAGPFSRGLGQEEMQANRYKTNNPSEQGLAVFDAQAEFIPKYATRRANFEGAVSATGAFRVNAGSAPAR